jgi:dGTPase
LRKSRPDDLRHSLGRPPDQRSLFERDRDRLLYAPAFHRLAGVTQVVLASEGSVFHNRLTHSLKVAQIARRLAEHLNRESPKSVTGRKGLKAAGGIFPDVAEAAGLAHDLGHPPFGHFAEQELDNYITQHMGVDEGFEGNAQSFRIVTRVSIRSTYHLGLDLTRRTLNSVLKYPWPRRKTGYQHKKFGYYSSEREDYLFARALGPKGIRKSIEAQVMDWADDITYAVHDLDDFYKAGLIPLHLLLGPNRQEEERKRFVAWANREKGLAPTTIHRFLDNLPMLAAFSPTGDPLTPFDGSREQRAHVDHVVSFLIRRYVMGTHWGVVCLGEYGDLEIDPRLREEVEILKALTAFYVFNAPALVSQQEGQRKVIRALTEVFDEALKPASRTWGLVPQPHRWNRPKSARERARAVADIITSMTEQQALLLYQRLTGVTPGSVRDVILY